MLDTLKYLKKGGRITPAVAALGTALRLKPVLQIQGEKLDALTVAKTSKRGISKMLDAIQDDIEKRFDGIENVHMEVAHTCNDRSIVAKCIVSHWSKGVSNRVHEKVISINKHIRAVMRYTCDSFCTFTLE